MRASDRAYLALREEIIEGALEPGAVLGEVEQSARLGLSRTPLREALSRLVADGLAAPASGRGVQVTAVSLTEATQLFDLRIVLEVLAVRRAAEQADVHDASTRFSALAERFERAVASLADGAEPTAYYGLTQELDVAVDDAVGNDYLADTLRSVRVHLARLRRLSRHCPGRLADSAREHAAIARAVASGNPELAAAATTVHLQQALAHLQSEPADSFVPTTHATAPPQERTA